MLDRLLAKKAELVEEIEEYKTEIAKAMGKIELIQELIDDETEEATEEENTEETDTAAETANNNNTQYGYPV